MNDSNFFCLIGKRGAGKDYLAEQLGLPTTTISNVLIKYCEQHGLRPDRDTLTQLGNTIFDGKTLATALQQELPEGGIITGLRKAETLYHLMQGQRCLLIGVLADDFWRRQRVCVRNRSGDTMSYAHFLEHERQENALPNKQNIELLLAFCDIHITNNGSKEQFIAQGKQALQKVLNRPPSPRHIDAAGYQHFTRAVLINEYNEVLVFFDTKKQIYTLPGGKCDTGETPDVGIAREVTEELGIDMDNKLSYCGSFAGLFYDGLSKGHFFQGTVAKASVSLQEPDIHHSMKRIPKHQLEKALGFQTFLDTGLYHWLYNKRIHHRSLSRDHKITTRTDDQELIQYIDPLTGKITLDRREGKLPPSVTPLRVMSGAKVTQGLQNQAKRETQLEVSVC